MTVIKILSEKQPNRTDSFFYYDPIAQATAKDGTVFTSCPTGEVRLHIGDIFYKNDQRFKQSGFDQLTDETISDDGDHVIWDNNNWFGIVADKGGEAYWDLEMIDFEYDSAISSLKNTVERYDRGELELR